MLKVRLSRDQFTRLCYWLQIMMLDVFCIENFIDHGTIKNKRLIGAIIATGLKLIGIDQMTLMR